jgi:PIN domain nuclease of toxin-antitoxin system
MLNLDTHVLVYALADDLTPRERSLLSNDTWSISAIVLWEIAKLSELGRIEVDLDHPELHGPSGSGLAITHFNLLLVPF